MLTGNELFEMRDASKKRKEINDKKKKLPKDVSRKYWRWEDIRTKKNNHENNDNSLNNINDSNSFKLGTKVSKSSLKKVSIISENYSDNSIFDEENNPIDPILYRKQATWK